jgi:hypothetical protein
VKDLQKYRHLSNKVGIIRNEINFHKELTNYMEHNPCSEANGRASS